MNKKYIIMCIVAILLAVSYFYYKDRSEEKEIKEWNEKKYARVVEIAKKSSRAGLANMGRSIEKYYTDNKKYPVSLIDLYPNYVANKALIENVIWEYVPGKDNFILKKSVIVKGKTLVASIDKNLKPISGQTILLASAKSGVLQSKSENLPGISDIASRLAVAEASEKEEKIMSASLREPQFELIKETENVMDFESEISHKYLVWKDSNGVRGFGNIQYPHIAKISIYSDGKRYDLKRSSAVNRAIASEEKRPGFKKDIDISPLAQSDKYLVWKYKNGTLGFGNLQYPDNKNIAYVNINGNWQKIGS